MSEFRFDLQPGVLGKLSQRLPWFLEQGKQNGIVIAAHAANGELAGTFTGKITGTFRVTLREALVTVTKKPMLATDGMVRSRLASLFEL